VVDEIQAITARTDRSESHPVRDDELRMMFTCAHPALDRVSQLALTLRLVSGLTVAEIARALLQTETAVSQRITRAKNKVRHANIPLRVPPTELLPERTPHVLSCIYSVFTEGYWSTAGPSAMQATRVDTAGALVPLEEQDRRRWDRAHIARGLGSAAAGARFDRPVFTAGGDCRDARDGAILGTDRLAHHLRRLRHAVADDDSPVVRANRALAVGFRDGPDAGLAALARSYGGFEG
jgi:RNA polymerase sigma-70 factor, ECF subfamily